MKDERNALFTSGQFAKLCGTTKETLFHYDELGLLRPVKVGENGYRYYTAAQFFDLDLIGALQEAGSPLKEIKRYLEHREPHAFAALLRENERKLALEKQKIERMHRLLRSAMASTESGLQGECGVPWVENSPEEWYIATPARGDILEVRNLVRSMQDHISYCDSHNFGIELAVGSIVKKDSLLAADFRESYYCTLLSKPVRSQRLYRKPAGQYACILHRGDYSQLSDTYPLLFQFLTENGLQICGDSFESDLLSYLAAEDAKDFVLKLQIQVEKG